MHGNTSVTTERGERKGLKKITGTAVWEAKSNLQEQ